MLCAVCQARDIYGAALSEDIWKPGKVIKCLLNSGINIKYAVGSSFIIWKHPYIKTVYCVFDPLYTFVDDMECP